MRARSTTIDNYSSAAAGSRLRSDYVLTVGLPEGSYNLELYKPPPNLFLTLAATSLSQEAIKQFADHYGPLGLSAGDGAVPLALKIASGAAPSTTGAEKRPLGTGELLSSWHEQIRAIRDATTLWSAIQRAAAGDSHQLIRHIKWLREDFVYYNSHPDYPLPRASLLLGILPIRKPAPFTKTLKSATYEPLRELLRP